MHGLSFLPQGEDGPEICFASSYDDDRVWRGTLTKADGEYVGSVYTEILCHRARTPYHFEIAAGIADVLHVIAPDVFKRKVKRIVGRRIVEESV